MKRPRDYRLLKLLRRSLGEDAPEFLAKARADNVSIAALYERLRYQQKISADAAEAICAEYKERRVLPRPCLGRRWQAPHLNY